MRQVARVPPLRLFADIRYCSNAVEMLSWNGKKIRGYIASCVSTDGRCFLVQATLSEKPFKNICPKCAGDMLTLMLMLMLMLSSGTACAGTSSAVKFRKVVKPISNSSDSCDNRHHPGDDGHRHGENTQRGSRCSARILYRSHCYTR